MAFSAKVMAHFDAPWARAMAAPYKCHGTMAPWRIYTALRHGQRSALAVMAHFAAQVAGFVCGMPA